MCNLYRLRSAPREVAGIYQASMPEGMNLPPEVYPGYPGLVVRQQGGQRVGQVMNWGFPLRLKTMKPTSKPKPVNNARDDKLMTPFWRHWFETPAQRCMIPFTEFAEAVGPKGKMKRTWISVTDQEVPAWAGLWRPCEEWGDVYTGVMVDATEELSHIHDRMPVILPTDAQDAWLNSPASEALDLLKKYRADQLSIEDTDAPWINRL